MEFKELVKKVAEKSGLSEKEVKEKAQKKQEELNKLVTLEGALHIVAGELGLRFFDSPKEHVLKLENIIPGMSSVDVVCRIERIYAIREFTREDKTKGKVAAMTVADDTASMRAVLWDKEAKLIEEKKLKEGDVIKIKDGYSKESMHGEPEIHVTQRTKIFINPQELQKEGFKTIFEKKKKISELKEGDNNVDVLCKLVRIYNVREFTREDKTKGKVANLLVGDDTGFSRAVLWNEDAGIIEKGELKAGDVMMIKSAYVKNRGDSLEINAGRYSKIILNPQDEEVEKIAKVKVKEKAERRKIAELEEGKEAVIMGALAELERASIYKKDGIEKAVVSCVIDDGSGMISVAFFDRLAEILLNRTTAEIKNSVEGALEERKKEILGKEIVIVGRVKKNVQREIIEMVASDVELNPDPIKEAERLLKAAGEIVKT